MGQPKITYQDTAPNAKVESRPTATNIEGFNDINDLVQEFITVPDVVTFEHNMWHLDGARKTFPDIPQDHNWGLIGNAVSDSGGSFTEGEEPTLTVEFDTLQSTVAITLDFDLNNHEYASYLTIQYFRDGGIVEEFEFYPNSETYICAGEAQYYNKLVIRFLKTNMPYRRIRLFSIYYGVIRYFTVYELESIQATEEIDPIGAELSVNTLDFAMINDDPIPFLFQKKQPLTFMYGDELIGVYFIDSAKRTGYSKYSITAMDSIGVLDLMTFYGGMYTNKNAVELLKEILTRINVEHSIDPVFNNETITGYLPICTCREALTQIAFVIGGVVDTSRSTAINVRKLSETNIKTFGDGEVYTGGTIDIENKVTAVEVTAYSYSKNKESTELYNGVLPAGENIIKFDSPNCDYSITGGTISESADNYIKVVSDGTTMVILTGHNYLETQTLYSKNNPDVGLADLENVKQVSSCTLVNKDNVSTVLDRVYNRYMKRENISTKLLLSDTRVGDMVEVPTIFREIKQGVIVSNNLRFGSKLVGEVKILGNDI